MIPCTKIQKIICPIIVFQKNSLLIISSGIIGILYFLIYNLLATRNNYTLLKMLGINQFYYFLMDIT